MTPERQLELLDRIDAHRRSGRGTDTASSSLIVATSAYTDPGRFAAERALIRSSPNLVGLSALLPGPRTYATVEVAGASVVLTRDDDGRVHAMLNVCSHRGAEVTAGCGEAARLSCRYHGWSFHLDGSPAARRRGEHFDDVPATGLTAVPVTERDGLLWVVADPRGELPDDLLQGAEAELRPLGLAGYRLFDSHTFDRPLNWKLAVDTFAEAYHVGALHRDSLAPMIHSDFAVFDPMGTHGRMIAVRRSIESLDARPRSEWELLPHATILWFLQPNAVLIHQQDHVELYRSDPGATPDDARLTASLYVPPGSTRSEGYWQRNFELLVEVTDTEDFATAAGIQRGFHTGAHDHVVFGRNEPALQHFHRSLDELLARVTA